METSSDPSNTQVVSNLDRVRHINHYILRLSLPHPHPRSPLAVQRGTRMFVQSVWLGEIRNAAREQTGRLYMIAGKRRERFRVRSTDYAHWPGRL